MKTKLLALAAMGLVASSVYGAITTTDPFYSNSTGEPGNSFVVDEASRQIPLVAAVVPDANGHTSLNASYYTPGHFSYVTGQQTVPLYKLANNKTVPLYALTFLDGAGRTVTSFASYIASVAPTPDLTPYLKIDGSRAMTGALDMGGQAGTNASSFTGPTDNDLTLYGGNGSNTFSSRAGDLVLQAGQSGTAQATGNVNLMIPTTCGPFDCNSFGTINLFGITNAEGNTITNLATPSSASDATTKAYVDTAVASVTGFVKTDGSTVLTANWDTGGMQLKNLAAPTATADAATKDYVDTAVAGAGLPAPLTRSAAYTSNFWGSPGTFIGNHSDSDQTNQLFTVGSDDTNSATNVPASAILTAGSVINVANTNNGGYVAVAAGNALGSGNGGSIDLSPGFAEGGGLNGEIRFQGPYALPYFPQTVAATDSIHTNHLSYVQIDSAADVTLSATASLEAGNQSGQQLELCNVGAHTITVKNGGTVVLPLDDPMAPNACSTWVFGGDNLWHQLSRNGF